MDFGYRSEVDRKRQFDLLALAQTQVAGLDEDAIRAQIFRLAEFALPAWIIDVYGRTCAVARVQSAFHVVPGILLIDRKRCAGELCLGPSPKAMRRPIYVSGSMR